jgi:hypothetical protein
MREVFYVRNEFSLKFTANPLETFISFLFARANGLPNWQLFRLQLRSCKNRKMKHCKGMSRRAGQRRVNVPSALETAVCGLVAVPVVLEPLLAGLPRKGGNARTGLVLRFRTR